MAEYTLELLQPAWKELDTIVEIHLRLVGPVSAQKITDKILDTLELLKTEPLMGRACDYLGSAFVGFRKVVCDNYLCFYKIVGSVIFVYHIVDGRTDYPQTFES
ncbi:MAG: type II toxin-antitoxin system RelE/ParE family toxin [Ruminococcus sp.]|nr:type II toxin-antitoxin system RelE/ParE family toxin [Ruminococcus sp.]